jgi:transcriptional regulator with XRE-family HTH domain
LSAWLTGGARPPTAGWLAGAEADLRLAGVAELSIAQPFARRSADVIDPDRVDAFVHGGRPGPLVANWCPALRADGAIDDTLSPMTGVEDQVAGALLKLARGRLGLSQRAFADLVGVAQPTLSAYESGRRQPTMPMLLRLLARAGLDLRMQLGHRDDHDVVLAEWERSLSEADRARLRAQGYRLVSHAA